MNDPGKSARRFRDRMAALGHDIDILNLAASTRSAQEAADTLGCDVAQIAKSIVFRDPQTDTPVLVVASGSKRVCTQKIATLSGAALEQASGGFVKKRLGYAIGGVPPAGHDSALPTFLDRNLRQYPVLWAAAGSPFSVFRLSPELLCALTSAEWSDVAE